MTTRVKHDGTVGQLERPAVGATKTSEQLDDKASVSETHRRHSASASTSDRRPPTSTGRRRHARRHNVTDSYVDESLFGPVTDDTPTAPWQPRPRPVKPFIFDCTDYKAKAAGTNNVPSSRPSSRRSARSRPQSARLHTQPSFVDESLFGDQLEVSTWRAPWEQTDRRPKPLIFDATNYREKQQRADSSDTRLQCVASTKQRPPWR